MNRFQKNSGVYICSDCGKNTRETGEGESDVKLCRECYTIAQVENLLSDEGQEALYTSPFISDAEREAYLKRYPEQREQRRQEKDALHEQLAEICGDYEISQVLRALAKICESQSKLVIGEGEHDCGQYWSKIARKLNTTARVADALNG